MNAVTITCALRINDHTDEGTVRAAVAGCDSAGDNYVDVVAESVGGTVTITLSNVEARALLGAIGAALREGPR